MSDKVTENIVDLSSERVRRVHDLDEKRLQTVRTAFANALPLAKPVARLKKKPKKKR